MKKNFTAVILVVLAILAVLDGDIANPSPLRIAKLVVIGIGLILQILVWRKERRGS
jgi:hypothetical protein